MIWKYGETNIENATDKNWISVTDSTWTQIIEPYAMKISAYRPPVPNCKPGAPRAGCYRSLSCLLIGPRHRVLLISSHHCLFCRDCGAKLIRCSAGGW